MQIHKSVYLAERSIVAGNVQIQENASVWFGAVIRGDVNKITIGANTNIQDNSVLHVDYDYPLTIGNGVTVGHGAILHGCTIGDNCLVGMGSTILNGAVIGADCLIGAGTLITQNAVIPAKSVVMGRPGKVVRQIKAEELLHLQENAKVYVKEAAEYKNGKYEIYEG